MEEEGPQTTKDPVPKFASFRPKQQTPRERNRSSKKNEVPQDHNDFEILVPSERHGERRGKISHHHKRPQSRESGQRYRQHRSRSTEHEQAKFVELQSPVATPTGWDVTPELFFTDRQ
ncbi:MAG: hypothetical protein M1830_010514, partial [Pleopsidium flavum]